MSRGCRKIIGLLSAIAVLFAQLAVSAYACPAGMPDVPGEMSMAAGPDADEDVFISPILCQKHCQNDQQTSIDHVSPLVAPVLLQSIIGAMADVRIAMGVSSGLSPALLRATSPPLAIRNCCFRI